MNRKKRLALAALLVAAGFGGFGTFKRAVDLPPPVEDRGFDGGFGGGGPFDDESGHPASVDTFRLLVRDAVYPPVVAVANSWVLADAYYDSIADDIDGSFLRYTAVKSGAPDSVQLDLYTGDYGGYTGRAAEYDGNPSGNGWMVFFWFDISSLPVNCKIEDAYIYLSPRYNGSFNMTTGWMRARVDTVSADYTMLNTGTPNDDPGWMDVSWNSVDNTSGSTVAWSPLLSARDDWNDFGPAGEKITPAATIDDLEAVRLDLSDPIQQVIDNGNHGRGIIVIVEFSLTSASATYGIKFGDDATKTATGNPALTVTATTRRGPRPWSGTRIPVSVVFDDNRPADPAIYALWDSLGWRFTSAAYRDSWDAAAESLWSANAGAMDLVMHTKQHYRLATLTDAQISYEVARDWLPEYITAPAIADTSALTDFAWVGGDVPKYTLNAIPILLNNGYRSARAATIHTDTTPIGELTYAAWEGFVNLFAISAESMTQSLLSETVHAKATFAERFKDMVDQSYTNRNKAAILLYTHGYQSYNDSLLTGPQRLRWFADVVNSTSGVEYKSYDWVVDQLAARTIVPPSYVIGNAASNAVTDSAAALYDSLLTADGSEASWVNHVWAAPYGYTLPPLSIADLTNTNIAKLGLAFPTQGYYNLIDNIGIGIARIEAKWSVFEPEDDDWSQGIVTKSDSLLNELGITPVVHLVCDGDHVGSWAVASPDEDNMNQIPDDYAEWEEAVTTAVNACEAVGVNDYIILNEWSTQSNSNGGWPGTWEQCIAFIDSTYQYINAADADANVYMGGMAATQELLLALYDGYITYPVYFQGNLVTQADLLANPDYVTLAAGVKTVLDHIIAGEKLIPNYHLYGTSTHMNDIIGYFDNYGYNWTTPVCDEGGLPSLDYVPTQSPTRKFAAAWFFGLNSYASGLNWSMWFKNMESLVDDGSQSSGNTELPMVLQSEGEIVSRRPQWYAYKLMALALADVDSVTRLDEEAAQGSRYSYTEKSISDSGVFKIVDTNSKITYLLLPGYGDGVFTVPAKTNAVQAIYVTDTANGTYTLGDVPANFDVVDYGETPVVISQKILAN